MLLSEWASAFDIVQTFGTLLAQEDIPGCLLASSVVLWAVWQLVGWLLAALPLSSPRCTAGGLNLSEQGQIDSLRQEITCLRGQVASLEAELREVRFGSPPPPSTRSAAVSDEVVPAPSLNGMAGCPRSPGPHRHVPPVPPVGPPCDVQGLIQEVGLALPSAQKEFWQALSRIPVRSPKPDVVIQYLQPIFKSYSSARLYALSWCHARGMTGTHAAATLVDSLDTVDYLLRWGGTDVLTSKDMETLCRQAYSVEQSGQRSPVGVLDARWPHTKPTRVDVADKEACQAMKRESRIARLLSQQRSSVSRELQ